VAFLPLRSYLLIHTAQTRLDCLSERWKLRDMRGIVGVFDKRRHMSTLWCSYVLCESQGLRTSPRASASLRYRTKRTFANGKIRRLKSPEALFRGRLNSKKNEEGN
jgi:hypothetical protein